MIVKKRLFFIASPHNALACLTIIKQDADSANKFKYEDYVIVHRISRYGHDIGKSWLSMQAILKILKVHNFVKIFDTTGYEDELMRFYKVGERDKYRERIFNALQEDSFDELYILKNFSKTYEMFAFLCSNAKLICYGEVYSNITGRIGTGLRKIDEFRTIFPIDLTNGLLDIVPLRIIPKKYLLSVISDVLEYNKEDTSKILKLNEYITEGNKVVLVLSHLSDYDRISVDEEIEMYLYIVGLSCSKNSLILIKEHPKSLSISKALHVQKALLAIGYSNIHIFDKALNTYPLEVICYHFKPDSIISPMSSALLISKYLYGISGNMAMDDYIAKRYGSKHSTLFDQILTDALHNLDDWDPEANKPLLAWKERESFILSNEGGSGKRLHDAVQGWIKPSNHEQFEVIIESFSSDVLADIYEQAGFKKIIFYGMCSVGKMIVDKLLDSNRGFELYLADPDAIGYQYKGYDVHALDSEYLSNIKADVVVCARTHSYNIYCQNVMQSKLRQHIVCSFAELLDVYYNENRIDIKEIISKLFKTEAKELKQRYEKLKKKFEQKFEELTKNSDDIKQRNIKLANRCDALKQKNDKLLMDHDTLKVIIDELAKARDDFQQQIDRYLMSTSWRITAPLRSIMRLFRKRNMEK